MGSLWKSVKTVLSLPIILVLAWVIAHLMAIFGVFATVAYPVWATIFGKKAVCLGCARLEDGEKCPLCNEKLENKEVFPKNIRSIVLNSLILLFLTLLSVGVVFLENLIIDTSGILNAGKTVSFVIPDKNQYRTNEIFPMKIEISGIQTAINVVQADLTFDPEILEVVDLSTKDSFASIFVQKDINNNLGYVRLTGGIPSPGYSKPTGTFGTIYFKTKSSGLVNVSFLPTSLVLADDGRGTNVLKNFPSVSYVVRPEALSAQEEAAQDSIFEKDVLGASTENTDVYSCYVELESGNLPEVLGVSNILDEANEKEESGKGTFYNYVIEPIISLIEKFDNYVISLYVEVLSKIFTN